MRRAEWDTTARVRSRYAHASILGDNRVVFNVKGNRYRLVAKINYRRRTLYVRFIGTHEEYDRIDAREM